MNRELENAAIEYLESGLSVIPITPGAKHPHGKWKHYRETFATPEEIESWENVGIGVITGKHSGIVVLDIDGPEARKKLDGKVGIPFSPIWQETGNGWHIFFRHPGVTVKGTVCLFGIPGIDVRADGNQILIDPTIHPNGKRYKLHRGCDWDELPICPDWMYQTNDGVVLENGKINLSNYTPQSPALWESIGEGGRDVKLTAQVGKLASYGLDLESLTEAAIALNEVKCVPPLDRWQVLKIVESIYKAEMGKTPIEVQASTEELELWEVEDATAARYFRSEPVPIEWLVPDLLPKIPYGILCAQGSSGKGWLVYQLVISMATGAAFLDKQCEGGIKTLIINVEDPDDQTHMRFLRCNDAQVDFRDAEIIEKTVLIPKINPQETNVIYSEKRRSTLLPKMLDLIEKFGGVDLIILDHLNRLVEDIDSNKNDDAAKVTRVLSELHFKTGATIILLAHVSKDAQKGRGAAASNFRGASAFVDNSRFCMELHDPSDEDLKTHCIKSFEEDNFRRLTVTKSNYTPHDSRKSWLLEKSTDNGLEGTFKLISDDRKGALDKMYLEELKAMEGRSYTAVRDMTKEIFKIGTTKAEQKLKDLTGLMIIEWDETNSKAKTLIYRGVN